MLDQDTQLSGNKSAATDAASMWNTVSNRLFEIDKLVSRVARMVNRDPDVSPAVASLVRDLQQKSKRAMRLAAVADAERAREVVLDLEDVIGRAASTAKAEGRGTVAIRALVDDMRTRITGLAEDLLGNDSD